MSREAYNKNFLKLNYFWQKKSTFSVVNFESLTGSRIHCFEVLIIWLSQLTEYWTFCISDESEDTAGNSTCNWQSSKFALRQANRTPPLISQGQKRALAAFLAAANNFDVRGMFRACENDGLSPVCEASEHTPLFFWSQWVSGGREIILSLRAREQRDLSLGGKEARVAANMLSQQPTMSRWMDGSVSHSCR